MGGGVQVDLVLSSFIHVLKGKKTSHVHSEIPDFSQVQGRDILIEQSRL